MVNGTKHRKMALGQEEAAAIIAGHSEEVEEIAGQLKTVMSGDNQDAYLIVSIGDFYLQFLRSGSKILIVEAVANEFLPATRRLDAAGIAKLADLGFEPPSDSPNFSMEFEPKDENDYAYLGTLALAALHDVYDCPHDESPAYELGDP